MMTPAYTVELQKRLKQSFQRIDEVLGHTDVLLLTEQQKRQVQAATAIQARIRTFVLRKRYVRGAHALRFLSSASVLAILFSVGCIIGLAVQGCLTAQNREHIDPQHVDDTYAVMLPPSVRCSLG